MLPAGKYYVGDLCYVIKDEWDEICNLTTEGFRCLSGEFQLADGRRFAMYSTKYGDGEYWLSNGKSLGVDSGTIGCVLLSDLGSDVNAIVESVKSLGAVVSFGDPFETGGTPDGKIYFGKYVVDTGGGDYNDDESYEY